jgi:hydroxyacylglutathione hydrolase
VARHLRLSATGLEDLAHKRWYPKPPVFPHGFGTFTTTYGGMAVNSYLVWDAGTKVAAAFDTGANAQEMLDVIGTEKLRVSYIFLTHTHEDHVADLERLARETRAEVWAHELEPAPHAGAKTFKENAHFHIGSLAIKTLLTNGHSPGMTSYFITGLSWPLAIVGDSIFSSSMGGSPTHFANQFRNNKEKLLTLPRDTVVASGHGPLTTIGQEKEHNPFFAR